MARYSLQMTHKNEKRFDLVFSIDGEAKTKVLLSDIDKYTIPSDEFYELVKRLPDSKMIESVEITYISNNFVKTLPVAYSDKQRLGKLTFSKGTTINTNNTVFKDSMNEFIRMLREPKFYNYVMKSENLSYKQKEYIEKITDNQKVQQTAFNYNKLMEYCSSYLQFRNILFLIEGYNSADKNRSNVETHEILKSDSNDNHDDGEEEFFYEEELAKQDEYMEQLAEFEKEAAKEDIEDEDYERNYR